LMRALWNGEEVTHRGQFYQTRGAKPYTRPPGPIPIYVSSLVPGSARVAGLHGDVLLAVGGQDLELHARMIEGFGAAAREAGKDPAKMPRLIELGVAYTDDEQKAIECRKAYWAGAAIPAMYTERLYTPAMSEANGRKGLFTGYSQGGCIAPADSAPRRP